MNDNFSKRYGQVLLKDKNIALKEVKFLNLLPGESVLEIGPGTGVLTDVLLKNDIKLNAIEPDHRFYEYLSLKYGSSEKFSLIKGSFIDMEPTYYDKIIGNIPYNLSSKIIFKLFDFDFKGAVLMVQKEFARRLVAKPGEKDYSRLTVNAFLKGNIKILFNVNRQVFSPVPGVDSSVILIEKKHFTSDNGKFDKFLIDIFSKRRKKISTILKNYKGEFMDRRPYEISPEDLLKIYYYFQ
ncbi:MAG: 16S rRNA (adenine(1518)-N(6)/adenine(1519)-N(6))-dimethyltransferase RsmA [Ferroplasma sp.]